MTPKRCRVVDWGGRLPEIGEYLKTLSGSMYLIIGNKPNTRPNAKSICRLDLLRLDGDEERSEVPDTAIIHHFQWRA